MMLDIVRITNRDLRIAQRSGGNWAQAAIFFTLFILLSAFALGPEQSRTSELAPALVWLAACLASQLSVYTLFAVDLQDGSLDCWVADNRPIAAYVLGKFLAHWLSALLPVILLAPVGAFMLGAPPAILPALVLSLVVGSPALILFGGMAAALAANIRGGGLLVVLISAPLLASPLIFGVGAVQAGLSFSVDMKILAAISLAAVVVCSSVSTLALKVHLE
ncbi:hypothetical protein MNBD_ALPHA06-1856 [hydrothermal vent metagenome]|uniref:Heme exporter protein B n=1 Tax=hydrothermal vent metagenome TaxID=652676 RepID=A0A3B0T392_9ZZZZ